MCILMIIIILLLTSALTITATHRSKGMVIETVSVCINKMSDLDISSLFSIDIEYKNYY